MHINEDFIFVHVPKTAGQSMGTLLDSVSTSVYDIHEPLFKAFVDIRPLYDSKFKWGFVRNPFDREVSNYIWHTRTNDSVSIDGFDDWVKWRYEENTGILTYEDFSDPEAYWYLKGFAKNQQVGFFVDPSGGWISDWIGRYETLEEDWNFIATKFDLEKQLPHEKRSFRKKDYRRYYKNSETVDTITKYHKIDLDVFGYDFENGMLRKEIDYDLKFMIHVHSGYNYYYG